MLGGAETAVGAEPQQAEWEKGASPDLGDASSPQRKRRRSEDGDGSLAAAAAWTPSAVGFSHYSAPAAGGPPSPPLPTFSSLPPARLFPFSLDPWQQAAVAVLHAGRHLLVSAHTSAGKSVAAEYGISLALQAAGRAVYCAPIKTLSNQKQRAWHGSAEYPEVGLLTGDVCLSPAAPVLVMTTEVLRHALFSSSSPLLSGVQCVVFDEVHYLSDEERGTVWEESLIALLTLHPSLQLVCLSATIGNARQLADWMAGIGGRTCDVVSTTQRPVPLLHYVFNADTAVMLRVKDERDRVLHDSIASMREAEETRLLPSSAAGRGRCSALFSLLSLCIARRWSPVIVFSFSRRECEHHCMAASSLTLTTQHEQSLITQVFASATASLSPADRSLPQVQSLLPLLLKGLATHHSGLLPVLKELVEILFGEGLLKLLFATETFAVGLHLPARCVVFAGWRKFDGRQRRVMLGAEYTQMSGRAGRRGVDAQGLCISLLSSGASTSAAGPLSSYSPSEVQQVLGGSALHLLQSRFTVGLSVILSVGRLHSAAMDVQDVIQRSLKQFQLAQDSPRQQRRIDRLERGRALLSDHLSGMEAQLLEYQTLTAAVTEARTAFRRLQDAASDADKLSWLQPGRLVWMADSRRRPTTSAAAALGSDIASGFEAERQRLRELVEQVQHEQRAAQQPQSGAEAGTEPAQEQDGVGEEERELVHFGWAVVLSCRKRFSPSSYVVDLLLPVRYSSSPSSPLPVLEPHTAFLSEKPPSAVATDANVDVVAVGLSAIAAVSSVRLYLPDDLRTLEARQGLYDTLSAVRAANFTQPAAPAAASPSALLLSDDIPVSSFPLLSPFQLLPASSHLRLSSILSSLAALRTRLCAHPLSSLSAARLASMLSSFSLLSSVDASLSGLRRLLESSSLLQAYHSSLSLQLRLLISLQYLHPTSLSLLAKGKVAAEIEAVNPLLLTELVFDSAFLGLSAPLVCAALSCLLLGDEQRGAAGGPASQRDGGSLLSAELRALYERLLAKNAELRSAAQAAGVEWKAEVRCGLMAAVQAWSSGEAFQLVMRRSNGAFEGSVVRLVRRLFELLQQLVEAARQLGSAELELSFRQAGQSVQRGIIFAGSLYQ